MTFHLGEMLDVLFVIHEEAGNVLTTEEVKEWHHLFEQWVREEFVTGCLLGCLTALNMFWRSVSARTWDLCWGWRQRSMLT